MAKISKPFRLATEGATCDGRAISRQDVVDMAETYNRTTYAAGANMEHIRGFSAEPPFCSYGSVIALSTAEVELDVGGKKEKRLALLGQVEPTDELVKYQAKKQKLYPSVEINPNFAGSGKAYLQGLAFTDSPASLGTEIMAFAANAGDASPFKSRKVAPGNLFSAAGDAVTLEFEEAAPEAQPSEATTILTKLYALLGGGKETTTPPTPAAPTPPAPPAPANDNFAQHFAQLVGGMEKLSGTVDAIATKVGRFETDFAALKTKVETTDNHSQQRPLNTGPAGGIATDC